jgi:mannose-6-phosphate isomerase-like protein (cupin superfamily)
MKRRNFIATSILGSLGGASFLTESFAQLPNDKPKAITNKIRKGPIKPLYVKPDNSPAYRGGTKIRFNQTNNQFSSFEHVIPPKTMGPAPHVHKDLDEIMRVVKGTVSVLIGNEVVQVEEGGWQIRPHGIVHTFWNAGDEPAVFIDLYPNQNFEVFLEEFIKTMIQLEKEGRPVNSKEGMERLDVLHKEWGIVMHYDQRQALIEKYGLKG